MMLIDVMSIHAKLPRHHALPPEKCGSRPRSEVCCRTQSHQNIVSTYRDHRRRGKALEGQEVKKRLDDLVL